MNNRQTQELLIWYDNNRRILPWREDPTPYHVWLSEIMLQQTRVEAGKAYYQRFLKELPDIASLAGAPEDVYLKLWEGLGYYTRVRNLHKAAVIIMEKYGGVMPGTAKELQSLPGIGDYTAAAIASIAFGQPEAAVDGNLLRIYARMMKYDGDIKKTDAKKAAQSYYQERIAATGKRPGDFNQALMDLGAMVCLPNAEPLCGVCPWTEWCQACSTHSQLQYPKLTVKKPRRIEKHTILLMTAGEFVAIRKRPAKGLLAGLYEFPGAEGELSEAEALREAYRLGAFAMPEGDEGGDDTLDDPVLRLERMPDARHIFSHVEWHMIGYHLQLASPLEADGLIWATKAELEATYSIPSAFEAYRSWLCEGDSRGKDSSDANGIS